MDIKQLSDEELIRKLGDAELLVHNLRNELRERVEKQPLAPGLLQAFRRVMDRPSATRLLFPLEELHSELDKRLFEELQPETPE